MPHPPQELAYRCDEYGDFVLSVGRLDRAKRNDLLLEAAALDPALRVVITGEGPDRERLEGLARERGLNGRAEFTGRDRRGELASLYARCLAVYYAPVDEDFGMVPVRGVPLREAGADDDRCRRAARDRHGRPHGPRRPRPSRRSWRRPPACLRAHPDEAESYGRAGKRDRRARHVGRLHRAPARMKVAYYSARCRRSARGSRTTAPCSCPRSRDGSTSRSSGVAGRARKRAAPISRSTTSATTRTRTAGSSTRCAAGPAQPAVVVLHDFVLHHLVAGLTIGRRDGHGYLDAMEREGGVVGRLLGHGVLDKRIPPLWESRADDFHLAGEVLDLATGLIVHSHYVEERARAAGYEGPIWRIPHPAWPVPRARSGRARRRSALRLLRQRQREQADPAAAGGVCAAAARAPGARLLLVGATSPGFDLDRRLQRLGLSGEGIVRRIT